MGEKEIREALDRSIIIHGISDAITVIISQELDGIMVKKQSKIYEEYKKGVCI